MKDAHVAMTMGAEHTHKRLENVRTILIAQTKYLGDLIVCSTLARNLQLEFPEARITFLCAKGFETFLTEHGIAANVVTFDRASMRVSPLRRGRELLTVLRKLRRQKFDLIIDLTDSRTWRRMLGLVKADVRVAFDPPRRPFRGWERQKANVLAKPQGFGENHFSFRYLSPLEALGIKLHARAPSIDPIPAEMEMVRALLAPYDLRPGAFVVIHAGASFIGRRWQPERFATVIDQLTQRTGLPHVLIGGPDEKDTAATILSSATSPVVNLVGSLSLGETLALLKQARLFIGNESGPMHLAAAAGTPVVGLFGLTDPAVWGPLGVPNITVRPSHPCDCIARDICHWPNNSEVCCVWRLTVDEVVEAACALLEQTATYNRP